MQQLSVDFLCVFLNMKRPFGEIYLREGQTVFFIFILDVEVVESLTFWDFLWQRIDYLKEKVHFDQTLNHRDKKLHNIDS